LNQKRSAILYGGRHDASASAVPPPWDDENDFDDDDVQRRDHRIAFSKTTPPPKQQQQQHLCRPKQPKGVGAFWSWDRFEKIIVDIDNNDRHRKRDEDDDDDDLDTRATAGKDWNPKNGRAVSRVLPVESISDMQEETAERRQGRTGR
jgi:hypothetical protein